jgi:hypothetical protein
MTNAAHVIVYLTLQNNTLIVSIAWLNITRYEILAVWYGEGFNESQNSGIKARL